MWRKAIPPLMGSRQHRPARWSMRGVRIEDDVPGAPGGVVSLTAFHCTLTLIGRRQRDLRKTAHARPVAR